MQQQELVKFLYSRVAGGILITFFISAVASVLAYIELSIQGREYWVVGWFSLLCLILLARLQLVKLFAGVKNNAYFQHQKWHNRFLVGVVASGLMQGCGAALLMPYVTINVQIILHSLLLGMSAGAIAFLSTALWIYNSYLVTIMLPVTIWLMSRQTLDGVLLGFIYLFMMMAVSIAVKRMNILVNDALYYRYDNETLVKDLQRLLESVSNSNKALEKISTTDELTGLSNYRAFRVGLEKVWRQYRGSNMTVSLVKINIDYFNEYNTHYGLEMGDLQLRDIARILTDEMTQPDQLIARLNGAEFALILPGVTCEDARLLLVRVVRTLASKKIEHEKSKADRYLTISIGLSCQYVAEGSSSRTLLSRADKALKSAKGKGRNRVEILGT
ncbi:MAG: GGDEF domain-containing protein [Gammaproteobacteria bacterium]